MFKLGDEVDGKYRITGVCMGLGGMGGVFPVEPIGRKFSCDVVLKYCKENGIEYLERFRREVRITSSLNGSDRVVSVLDSNLNHNPPYFIMPFYREGDLDNRPQKFFSDPACQEKAFVQMIDCVQELHSRNIYHRDIKPQNFLVDGDKILVSDLGLSAEVASDTRMTRSSMHWGTLPYLPPEFHDGDFKNISASSDIFMLGKTIYYLLTGNDPQYIKRDRLNNALFYVVERACNLEKTKRFQSLAEMKAALSDAYDIILGRAGRLGRTRELLLSIESQAKKNTYEANKIREFVKDISMLEYVDQEKFCLNIFGDFFKIISQRELNDALDLFTHTYKKVVECAEYGWSFSETIANNMEKIFYGDVPSQYKCLSLEIAIIASHKTNRFAAMDTCRSMILKIQDEALGLLVGYVLESHPHSFVLSIDPGELQSEVLRKKLRDLKNKENNPDT